MYVTKLVSTIMVKVVNLAIHHVELAMALM